MATESSHLEVRASEFGSLASVRVKLISGLSEPGDQVGMDMENALAALKTHVYQYPVAF